MTARRRMSCGLGRAVIGLVTAIFIVGPAIAAHDSSVPATSTDAASLAVVASDAQVLRGSFVQKKYLAELSQPLVSRGHYVVARGHGLLWMVEQPIASTLVITPDALTENSAGTQTMHISADQQPALGAVASILLAVFRGNTAQLDRYFAISDPQADAGGWSAVLVPRSDAVGQFISRLDIHGDTQGNRDVRHIVIHQPGGDHSDIRLSPAAVGNDSLSAEEKAAFAH